MSDLTGPPLVVKNGTTNVIKIPINQFFLRAKNTKSITKHNTKINSLIATYNI